MMSVIGLSLPEIIILKKVLKWQLIGIFIGVVATGILVVTGLILMAIGLSLVNDTGCKGACESLGFTLLYAGLPVSAIFGFLFGDLVVAWPLDITLWVILGVLLARFSDNRGRSALGMVLVAIVAALLYGLVLSRFVEMAI